jgi:nucleoside-diphosphate-sugar epimerase
MKVLFIGGTGNISTQVSRQVIAKGFDLYRLNRGRRVADPADERQLTVDMNNVEEVRRVLGNLEFDVVVNWIAFAPEDIERDLELFSGRTKQYIFISSASVYEKPPSHHLISEATRLSNPYWDYARQKIACEERLMQAWQASGFPATIVRPSFTYDHYFPVAVGGSNSYTLAKRIKEGRPIIVHGDGSSLWVMTHAEDFGRGFIGLLGNEQALGEAFHITTDEVLTWNQIYETIGAALGTRPNIVHITSDFIARVVPRFVGSLLGDKTWSVVFDNTKIKKLVPGFEAVISFQEGTQRAAAWLDAAEERRWIDATQDAEMDQILKAFASCAA